MAALILVTTFLAVVLAIVLVVYLQPWKPRKEVEASAAPPLPPGPRGMPLLGYLPFLGHDLRHTFTKLARSYGPVMSLRVGSKLCVVLSSPAAIKEMFTDHDAIFANHGPPAVGLASTNANSIAWAPNGPVWRMLRKMSVQEMHSPAVVDGLQAMRRREVLRMTETVRRRAGQPVNVRELALATVTDVLTTMLWGSALEESQRWQMLEVIGSITDLLAAVNVSDLVPMVAPLDLQRMARRMQRLWARLDHIFDPAIEERQQGMVKGEGDHPSRDGYRDFLQVMVEHLQNQRRDTGQVQLTIKHVKALLVDMIIGGTDTTSITVEFAMAALLCNPEVMRKAREEIEVVVGKDGILEESHLPRLHYLEAVMKETLRLHPVLPLLLPHRPSSTCTIMGYSVPAESKMFINIWAIHRDPQFWEDPTEFKPERFLNGGISTGKDFVYLPYGGGRRICVGIPLGRKMVMLMLASLLHVAHWTLPEGVDQVDMSEEFGFFNKLKRPLVAVPMLI